MKNTADCERERERDVSGFLTKGRCEHQNESSVSAKEIQNNVEDFSLNDNKKLLILL